MINLFDFIPPAEHAAIQAQTSTFACDSAVVDAMAALGEFGGAIETGSGKFVFADTINLQTRITLWGAGSGEGGSGPTVFDFPAGKNGVVVNRYDTFGDGLAAIPRPINRDAEGSIIRGIRLQGHGGVTGHGIRLRARATVEECQVYGFGLDGINIVADSNPGSGDSTIGNANGWMVRRVRSSQNGRHGMLLQAGDANAGCSVAFHADANGGCGLYDSSFLGNTHDAPQTAGNALAPFKTDGASADVVLIRPYVEGGQPPSELTNKTVVLGHIGVAAGNKPLIIAEGKISPHAIEAMTTGATPRQMTLGVNNVADQFLELLVAGDDSHGWQFGYWNEGDKTYQFRHKRLANRVAFSLTSALGVQTDEAGVLLGGGKLILKGAWVPIGVGQKHRYIDLLNLSDRLHALDGL